jgi:hypothetical protein
MAWILLYSFVVFYGYFTYFLKISTNHKGGRGRQCRLAVKEAIALKGKIPISTGSLNIVNGLWYCFHNLGAQSASLVGGYMIYWVEQWVRKLKTSILGSAPYLSEIT